MSAYSPLFSIGIEHAFWGPSTLALTCTPTPQTVEWMRRRDVMLRPLRNGVALYCESARRALLLDRLQAGSELLGFKWFAQDPLFSRYSLPVVQAPDQLLFVRSEQSVATGDGRYCLHGGVSIGSEAAHQISEPQLAAHLERSDMLRGPVLVAQVDLADQVAAAAGGIEYYVHFDVRKSFWKYYLMASALSGSNEPINDGAGLAVVDLDDAVHFMPGVPEQLPGNRHALVFLSEQEIEMQQQYPQRFQLREQGGMGERVLIRRLPNADVSGVTQEMIGNRAALVSEIYIN